MTRILRCSTCPRMAEASAMWFHPGTGEHVCDVCRDRASSRHTQVALSNGRRG